MYQCSVSQFFGRGFRLQHIFCGLKCYSRLKVMLMASLFGDYKTLISFNTCEPPHTRTHSTPRHTHETRMSFFIACSKQKKGREGGRADSVTDKTPLFRRGELHSEACLPKAPCARHIVCRRACFPFIKLPELPLHSCIATKVPRKI